jgi:RimJ/RimL family protein N-acetyltransferase
MAQGTRYAFHDARTHTHTHTHTHTRSLTHTHTHTHNTTHTHTSRYMPYGPFTSASEYHTWMGSLCKSDDTLFHAVIDARDGVAKGVCSYLRIDHCNGVVEIGHIALSPLLQRTTSATEMVYLLLRRAFDELGYRRVEWKCDSLNAPSRAAALRFGFRYEGTFEQNVVYKGRNRDTAWFAITDARWPAVQRAMEAWLDPENFDGGGQQRQSLSAFMDVQR